MAIVYRHIRLDKNEPFYIGIGKEEQRAFDKRSRNIHWKRIINKTDYEIEILFDNLTWDEACKKEIEFIKLYGRKDLGLGPLVNMTDGGDGTIGHKASDETRKKISNGNKGKKLSDETKLKLSIKHTGKKLSEKQKQQISEFQKGRLPWCTGLKLSNEHKIKLSNAAKLHIGEKNNFYGKIHSSESKLKMSLAKLNKTSKKTVSISIDGKIFNSIAQASRELNIHNNTIIKRLKSKNFPTYIKIKKEE